MSESIDEKIVQLVDMGFTAEQAGKALQASNNNVETAISFLFEEPIEVQEVVPPSTTAKGSSTSNSISASSHPTDSFREYASTSSIDLGHMDTVAIRNPLDIPDLTGYNAPAAMSSHEQEVEESDSEQTPDEDTQMESSEQNDAATNEAAKQGSNYPQSSSSSSTASSMESFHNTDQDENDLSIFRKLDKYHFDETVPKLVVPYNASHIENYIAPLIIILAQLDKFQQAIFDEQLSGFKDYGWDADWFYKGDLNVLVPSDINGKKKTNAFKNLIEIQRIIAFLLSTKSKRLFISTYNLLRSLETDFFVDSELIEEVIPKIYEFINTCVAEVGNNDTSEANETSEDVEHNIQEGDEEKGKIEDKKHKHAQSKLDSLFRSTVYSESEEQANNIYHIDTESNSIDKNIYDSFNELIWGNDLEQLGQIYFTELSDIISISKIGETVPEQHRYQYQNNKENGQFVVLEEFFPQIYSEKYKDIIISINKEKELMYQKKLELTKKLNKLNFFEGKKLGSVLERTLSVFSEDSETHKELKLITTQIEGDKAKITEEMEVMRSRFAATDIFNPDNILTAIKSQTGETLSPYICTGIVQSQKEYCYRTRGTNEWIYVKFIVNNPNDIVEDIVSETFSSFDELMERFVPTGNETNTFIYVKRETWEGGDGSVKIPHSLQAFFDRDNAHIAQRNKEAEEEEVDEEEQEEHIQEDRESAREQIETSSAADVNEVAELVSQ